jgi:hypothetical protein
MSSFSTQTVTFIAPTFAFEVINGCFGFSLCTDERMWRGVGVFQGYAGKEFATDDYRG